MEKFKELLSRITQRVNINLRERKFDVRPYLENLVPFGQFLKFYAFYGITPNHSLNFRFRHSSLAGSYFLGKCRVNNSILYKSDIRGDELRHKGDRFPHPDFDIILSVDEEIDIEDSFLIKTLVHCFSHDPETPEKFFIHNTVSTHYANIHGSPMDGSFLGPLATVDLTTMNDCIIGAFSYIQAGEIQHEQYDPGTVLVQSPEFTFLYKYPLEPLKTYIRFSPGEVPSGVIMDFIEERKKDFDGVFDVLKIGSSVNIPSSSSLDRFAVLKPSLSIGDNVLVSQRAYLENSTLGKGANAQENCFIVNSTLNGFNVTAHGAKIIEADLGKNVFVGFNSFLRGTPENRLNVGESCVIMPHTIIDCREPLTIKPGHLVWGLITNQADIETNTESIANFEQIDTTYVKGNMSFEGDGASFITAFKNRIHHILESNGAFFDGTDNIGHAQRNRNISFNTIQPYPEGELEGLFPTIRIEP